MKKRVGSVIILLVVVGLLPRTAGSASNNIAPAPVKTGEIRGAVAYCGPGGNSGIGIYIPGRSYQATLGANGQFVLSLVPPGTYNLNVQIPGHAGDVIPNVVVADNTVTDLGSIALCRDSDHDGFTEATDCNDNNPMVHPNATEACDGLDNNCNAQVDEGCALCTDADKDGFYAQAGCLTQQDCNDNNSTVRPSASELCDSIDNNCNGLVDEGFDLSSDPSNCGTCGNTCSFANAGASCSGGSCQLGACSNGFADCDAAAPNGCETNLLADTNHCGACGNACSLANTGSASCLGGSCQVASCSPGFGDCNLQASDGCEINVNTDTNNCGACGSLCSLPHASAACSGGSCQLGACSSGFANCDGQASDGCETDIRFNPGNCGACGNVCPSVTFQCGTHSCNCHTSCDFFSCQTFCDTCPTFCTRPGSCSNGFCS